jgi:hypothetical protein
VLGLAGLTVAMWWAWLGRDARYQVDPATGATSGPYQVWQVVGCVLCLAVVAIVGGMLLPSWVVAVSMTIAFTVAWSIAASVRDDSGMWPVGAFLVLMGMAIGSTVLSLVGLLVRRHGLGGRPR